MDKLYENIKNRRIALGMTQEELAKKMGYTNRSSIAKIENGAVDLSQSKIVQFAKVLEITPGELMGDTPFDASIKINSEDLQILEAISDLDSERKKMIVRLARYMGDQ